MENSVLNLVLKFSEEQHKFNSTVIEFIKTQKIFNEGQLEANGNLRICIEHLDQCIKELEKIVSEKTEAES